MCRGGCSSTTYVSLCNIILPNTSATISRYVARRCMLLENVNKFDWAKDIANKLNEQLSSKRASDACINGCVMAILYWFCDISQIVEPIQRNKDEIATFLKWNLGEVHYKLENMEIKDIMMSVHLEETHNNTMRSPGEIGMDASSSRTPTMNTPQPPCRLAQTPTVTSDSCHGLSHLQKLMNELQKEKMKSVEQQHLLEGKNAEIQILEAHKMKGDAEIEKLGACLDASALENFELRAEIVELKSLIAKIKEAEVYVEPDGDQQEKTEENDVEDNTSVGGEQSMRSMIRKIKQRGSRKKVDFKRDLPSSAIVSLVVHDVIPLNCSPPPQRIERKGKERVIELDDFIEKMPNVGSMTSLARLKQTKVWKNELSNIDRVSLETFWENKTTGDALWENNDEAIGKTEIDEIF